LSLRYEGKYQSKHIYYYKPGSITTMKPNCPPGWLWSDWRRTLQRSAMLFGNARRVFYFQRFFYTKKSFAI